MYEKYSYEYAKVFADYLFPVSNDFEFIISNI